MGIFGKIGDWFKSTAGKVGDWGKGLAGKLGSGMDWVRDKVNKGVGVLSNIPVIGDAVKLLTNNPMVTNIASTFNAARDAVGDLSQGNIGGAISRARNIANAFSGGIK